MGLVGDSAIVTGGAQGIGLGISRALIERGASVLLFDLNEEAVNAAAAELESELGAGKASAKCGMAMTEKQGGSDVRANTTRAEEAGDGWWSLTGHKWFCSAPMCDLFLVLAQTD